MGQSTDRPSPARRARKTRRVRGEGSIFFESDRKRWVGVVDLGVGVDGKRSRRKVTGATRPEVRDRMDALLRAKADGLPVANGRETLGAFLEDWLAKTLPARVHSVNTIDNYAWAIRKHIIPALGTRTLRALTAEDVEKLLRAKVDAGMARNSVMRIRSVLADALRHAERRGKVPRNVATLVDTPAAPSTEGRSLTVEQAGKLLEVAIGDRLEALYVTGLMCGLRPGELLGLAWGDLDLDPKPPAAPTLQVRQSLKPERGKLRIGDPKTKRSWRALDLPSPVIDALRAHKRRQAAERLAAGPLWQDSDLVFATTIGTPIDPSNLRRWFAKLTVAAGLGHWHPHELRHSTASLLSAAGVPLEQIADVLGHDGTRMTSEVYRHAVKPTVGAAVATMESLFGAS